MPLPMAGYKERYKVRYEDGTIRTVTAQSYIGAKRVFIARYSPPKGAKLVVWPQGSPDLTKNFRV